MNWKYRKDLTYLMLYTNFPELLKEFDIIPKPAEIPQAAERDGVYISQVGVDKGYKYLRLKDTWYLVAKWCKDEGRRVIRVRKFKLYPNLSERVYESMYENYKYLSKEWKLNCSAWYIDRKLRKQERVNRITSKKLRTNG